MQLLGTSGTVTTLAGVALGLSRYRRPLVDGTVLTAEAADEALANLRALGREGLEAHPCVGPERVDFVLPGCAVFAALVRLWPAPRVDRGRSWPARGHAAAHDPRRSEARPAREGPRRSPAPRGLAVAVRTAKSRSAASQRWLARQLNDPYVAAAKQQGFRSRAAFKLVELDERFRLIRRGALVVDLGAAPGGWTQVAVQRGAARVVGGGSAGGRSGGRARCMLQGDFTEPEVQERLLAELGGKADLVLSDMAPNTTGHAATDHLRIMALAEAALEFAIEVLAEGGGFVAKVFQGGAENGDAGAAEAALRRGAARQAAGQPQGVQRALRGGDGVPRLTRA